jgi:hypothetical protein
MILVSLTKICLFTSRLRIFHWYGTSPLGTGEGLQNLGLCLALTTNEQGEIFIVPHLLSAFPVSFEGPPHLIASYDLQVDADNFFLPGHSRVKRENPPECVFCQCPLTAKHI